LERKVQLFSQGFLYVTFSIAFLAGLYWFFIDSSKVANVFTAVLVVACPCALSLAMPFALGNALRLLGREGFYLRNAEALLHLAEIDTLVFDKTGTIMENDSETVAWVGESLTHQERAYIALLCRSSMHPLSRQIFDWLNLQNTNKYILITVMIIIAVINLITCLIILLLERTPMIALLKALGARDGIIQRIFIIYGSWIAGIGILLGTIIGLSLCYLQQYGELIQLNEEAYYVRTAPVAIDYGQVLMIMVPSPAIHYHDSRHFKLHFRHFKL
jgi:predicted lysophospholipase L1 biosynthesis ABC-type transport system permease subunit